MGARSSIGTAPSDEITTFSYGHFNVWPLTVNNATGHRRRARLGRASQAAGAGLSCPTEATTCCRARSSAAITPATQVIQINHFNSGTLGHFNNLGIDTEAVPPESTSTRLSLRRRRRGTLPCQAQVCIGGLGGNELAACTTNGDCPGAGRPGLAPVGRGCPGGSCSDSARQLVSPTCAWIRPSRTSTTTAYTALEVWIEAESRRRRRCSARQPGRLVRPAQPGRLQDRRRRLRHAQRIRCRRADRARSSRRHGRAGVDQSRRRCAQNVNAGRAIGSNGLFMRVESKGDGGATASHALGDPLTVPATSAPAT